MKINLTVLACAVALATSVSMGVASACDGKAAGKHHKKSCKLKGKCNHSKAKKDVEAAKSEDGSAQG